MNHLVLRPTQFDTRYGPVKFSPKLNVEFYPNGDIHRLDWYQHKLITSALYQIGNRNLSGKPYDFREDGSCYHFYSDAGQELLIGGQRFVLDADRIQFYPNGNIHCLGIAKGTSFTIKPFRSQEKTYTVIPFQHCQFYEDESIEVFWLGAELTIEVQGQQVVFGKYTALHLYPDGSIQSGELCQPVTINVKSYQPRGNLYLDTLDEADEFENTQETVFLSIQAIINFNKNF